MTDEKTPQKNEILLYTTPDGAVRVDVQYEDESFWLSQKKMAELFGVDVRTVSEHLRNVYAADELHQKATIRKFRIVQTEGAREVAREVDFYNLDAIIAVGYRVNSYQATQFRIWATQTLREFIVKGFVLDDERLKQGKRFGKDYFDELLERIREIRASERRFYLKITDIYEQCSIDYDRNAEITQTFFKTVQNKLHWAITGKTAAELIAERARADHPNMGLQTWKQAPHGKILKTDVAVAKNYLTETEIKALERVVSIGPDRAARTGTSTAPAPRIAARAATALPAAWAGRRGRMAPKDTVRRPSQCSRWRSFPWRTAWDRRWRRPPAYALPAFGDTTESRSLRTACRRPFQGLSGVPYRKPHPWFRAMCVPSRRGPASPCVFQ